METKKEWMLSIGLLMMCVIAIPMIVIMMGEIFLKTIKYAMEKEEISQCIKLEEYSRAFEPHFYMTANQKEMCDKHDIIINSPIKPPYESK